MTDLRNMIADAVASVEVYDPDFIVDAVMNAVSPILDDAYQQGFDDALKELDSWALTSSERYIVRLAVASVRIGDTVKKEAE